MKPKQIYILLGILGFLILGIVFKQLHKPAELATEEFSSLDLSLDPEKIQKIEISKPGQQDAIQLLKRDAQWRVESFLDARADSDKISRLLNQIWNVKGEIRGASDALFPDFGIENNQAIRIKIEGEGQAEGVLTLLIGIKKAGPDSAFIRKEKSNSVYLVQADLLGSLGILEDPAPASVWQNYWASTRLLAMDLQSAGKLETKRFQEGKEIKTASIIRESSSERKWKFERKDLASEIDPAKVEKFLESLKTINAQEIAGPKSGEYTSSTLIWKMKIGLAGKEIELSAGKAKDSESIFIQVPGEPVVFKFNAYDFGALDIEDSHFLKDNPPKVESGKPLSEK